MRAREITEEYTECRPAPALAYINNGLERIDFGWVGMRC